MGRERARTRQLIRFCIACVISVVFTACAEVRETKQSCVEDKEPRRTVQCPQPPPVTRQPCVEDKEPRKTVQCPQPAAVRLAHAKKLLSQGDVEGALKESQKWLSVSGKNSPADEALFTMGLAYIHHKNPKRDYRQALEHFDRLVREFPQSPLADQAMTWLGVLRVIEQSKEVDLEIEKMKKELVR